MSVNTTSRERLLDVTGQLLARHGTHGVGLKQVTAEAGVSHGSLYHAFPGGKEELVAASIHRSGEEMKQRIADLVESTPDLSAAASAIFEVGAAELAAGEYVIGCPIAVPVSDAHDLEHVRQAGAECFASLASTIADSAVRAGAEWEAAASMALNVLCLYEGARLVARAQRSTAPLTSAGELAAQLAAEVLQ